MAERRMFAKTIVLSDAFLDMPLSARCLYFTLGMLADDDGFVNSPKSIMRQCGASEDDIKLLLAKKFILSFESGVIVIKHWRINNYLRSDRYTSTKYVEEKGLLNVDKNGAYSFGIPCGIPSMGIPRLGKDRLGKVSLDKDSIDENNVVVDVVEGIPSGIPNSTTTTTTSSSNQEIQKIYGKYNNVCITVAQYNRLLGICASQNLLDELIDNLSENIEQGKEEPYKDHLPNAHYIRLTKYFDYRRKNPNNFRQTTETKSEGAKAIEKWYDEMKARGYGS